VALVNRGAYGEESKEFSGKTNLGNCRRISGKAEFLLELRMFCFQAGSLLGRVEKRMKPEGVIH